MKIGFCGGPDVFSVMADAGADYIETGVSGELVPLEDDAAFEPRLRVLAASPLPILNLNGFLPSELRSTGPDFVPEQIADYTLTACQRAKLLGVQNIVFGSGGSRQLKDDFPAGEAEDQFVEVCKKIAPIAADHGITIVIEPLRRAECNFINTVREGARIVEETGHPGLQLLADLFHMIENGETTEDLAATVGFVKHVHVAEPQTRTAPGVTGYDFVPFFKVLHEAGYDACLSVEAKYDHGLEADAATAVDVLREQLAAAGY